MSSEEIELSSTSSISDNSSRPGLSKSKGKAIIMSEPVGEAIGEVETKGGTTTQLLRHRDTYCPKRGVAANQSVINVELGKMEHEVSKKDFKYNHAKIYNEVESKKNIELVSGSLLEVYKEYVLNHALHCSSVTKEMNVVGGSSSTTTTYKAKGKTKYDLYVRSMENVMHIKFDLETYLEGVYICEVNCESQFDVIGWWKANNLKYKILSKMVVDILLIPITTVASEATFNTGGRVIDPYRASLSTKTVEALICGGDWTN
ncbi:hypothetical protein RJ639_039794 [Escallonia herrerae]|uniref:HAT C-terminal dimerisation domain-containing protein n=1 Tax=Escallonia herrerae TaxID=1293975 RepID=A0AA88WVN6_9ASTE|nr:hypothetical protein RJ639_039794 [Escallonia herrerae]